VDRADLAALALRLLVGLTMAFHGYAKLFRGGRVPGLTRWFAGMVMRPARLNALLAIGTEVGGGLLLAAGLLTPLAAAAMVGLMVVAWWTVHKGSGFLVTGNGWEYNLVLAATAVVVALLGPGRWSLDHALSIDVPVGLAGAALALGVGVAGAALQLAACYRPAPPKT
jgi:putative oxidoreductase